MKIQSRWVALRGVGCFLGASSALVSLGLGCSGPGTGTTTGGLTSTGAGASSSPTAGTSGAGVAATGTPAGGGSGPVNVGGGGAPPGGGGAPGVAGDGSVVTTGGTTTEPSGAGAPGDAGAPGVAGGTSVPPDEVESLIGDVAFSTPSQSFVSSLEVGLTTAVAGAEIRYTTDGTLPVATSTVYAGTPLTLTATTQLRAQAFVAGAASGLVSTALYIARTFELTSTLPIFILDGYAGGKPTDKTVYLDAAVMTFEPVDGAASVANLPTLATRAGYHIRGQSSASFDQAPYKVELWNNASQDVDLPLLGMPADSDWALIPPYYDRTLIRNPFVYELGREMGLLAPRNAYAEVYINFETGPVTEEDYQGVYWISETIKNSKERINLKQLKDESTLPDISGGYIFKFDQAASEPPELTCTGAEPLPGFSFGGGQGGPGGGDPPEETGTCWVNLEVVDPDPVEGAADETTATPTLVPEQAAWLTTYIQTFHDSLHATPIGDYGSMIDLPSFVDYLILNELTYQVDAYVRSAYYHKDRDGLLTAGPLWDYNFALGGVGAQVAVPEGDASGFRFGPEGRNVNNWYQKLTADEPFMALVRTRWASLRTTLLADAAITARIDELASRVAAAAPHDFERWPVDSIILSETGFTGGPTAPTWEGQVQVMRDFLTARLAWMDTQFAQ